MKIRFANKDARKFINFFTFDFLGISQKHKSNKQFYNSNNISQLESIRNVEENLKMVFNPQTIFFNNDTDIHIKVLESIIGSKDLIVLDQFVNINIRIAAQTLQKRGIQIEYIRHNQLNDLENIIIENKSKVNKIWYVAQSVYFLSGDTLPIKNFSRILKKYEQLFLYVDDSDGLSWTGEKGKGFICQNFNGQKKIIMVASLSGGFGADAGAIIITEEDINKYLSFHSSGSQLKYLVIKSLINSSEMHLSDEIMLLQLQLQEKVEYFNNLINNHSLPIVSEPHLPGKFLAVENPGACQEICASLLKKGIYVSSALYPQFPANYWGIKINISLNHSMNEIKTMVCSLKEAYHSALKYRKTNGKLLINTLLFEFKDKHNYNR